MEERGGEGRGGEGWGEATRGPLELASVFPKAHSPLGPGLPDINHSAPRSRSCEGLPGMQTSSELYLCSQETVSSSGL